MKFKDYYDIMGVKKTATQDEIKRSYRKLARKYHPDVSKEASAEEHFKELGEAYEVLKDPEKRASYDNIRAGGWQADQEFKPPPDWQYSQDFTGGGYTRADTSQFSDFFESLFGQAGAAQGHPQRTHFRTRGEDLYYKIELSLEEAFQGITRAIQLNVEEVNAQGQIQMKTRSLNVKIPKGVITGQQIRLKGQGAKGFGGGENGDLYLEAALTPHAQYQLDGRDVTFELPLTPWEAALGAKIKVPTLSGPIELKIPAGSQSGQKLRLKGKGLPSTPSGDQYIKLKVVLPKADSKSAKELYQQMSKQLAFNPREALGV